MCVSVYHLKRYKTSNFVFAYIFQNFLHHSIQSRGASSLCSLAPTKALNMNIEKWRLERFPSTSTCTIHSSAPTKNVMNCLLSVFERIAIVSSSTTKLLFFMVNPVTVKPNAFDGSLSLFAYGFLVDMADVECSTLNIVMFLIDDA